MSLLWCISFIFLLPLIGGISSAMTGKSIYSLLATGSAFLLTLYLLISGWAETITFAWLPDYDLSIRIDAVASLLLGLVLFIALLVQIFSVEYMREDPAKGKYFGKLGLFTSSMLGLLMADHLILLFVFWELVGLSSYLLIGFWYRKDGVPKSARMAFMVNRVADVALLAGILILNAEETLMISTMEGVIAFLPSTLIALGAFGKSAQLPFSGWLTKAMVGPTPVSALIHAATMVAAGVYLLFRISDVLHPDALVLVAVVGSVTACYGAVSALFQYDIKKVLAYSTISQLGYMFIGIGVGAKEAALFHLFTHAFFKAGLFLGAGSIIHALHHHTAGDAQDMRIMGGLKSVLPWTFRTFLIYSSALAGIPFFSGFMSKEGIIIGGWQWAESTGTWGYLIPDLALVTALITALYVGRMVLLVFFGENRMEREIKIISERSSLFLPLLILALGSLWIVFNWNPFAHQSWLDGLLSLDKVPAEGWVSHIVLALSIIMTAAGLVLAYSFFKPGTEYQQRFRNAETRSKLVLNGFYLTDFYTAVGSLIYSISLAFQRFEKQVVDRVVDWLGIGTVVFSKIIALIDRFFVDGPVNLVAYLSALVGRLLAGLSSRDLQTQLSWLLVFVILILSWILFF